MADEEIGTIFDNRSADLIAQVTRTVLGQVKNYLSSYTPDNGGSGGVTWHNAAGSTSEDIPGRSIVRVSTLFTWCQTFPLYTVAQPSTVWTDRYAIVHPAGIKRNEVGYITFEGPCEQLADSTAITKDDRLGPKAGQYTQAKGYPATSRVDGVVSATSKVYFGPVHPITTIIGKTTGAMAATTASTGWRLYGGTQGSETDIGVAPFPVVSRSTIASNKWIKVTLVNNGGEAEKLEC